MTIVNHKYEGDYFKLLGRGLYELVMNDKLTDLRFVTMNSSGTNIKIINAHQFILCSKSPFLQEICHEARTKQLISDPVVLTLPGVSASAVQDLVKYFYLGEANFNSRKELQTLCALLGIVDVELDDSELEEEDLSQPEIVEIEIKESQKKKQSLKEKGRRKSRIYNKETGYYSDGSYLNDCRQCYLFFVTEKSYLNHIDSHQKKNSSSEAKDECPSQGDSIPASPVTRKSPRHKEKRNLRPRSLALTSGKNSHLRRCKFCDRVFNNSSTLQKHTIIHFRKRISNKLPSDGPFRCPDCSKVMCDRGTLFRHYCLYHRHILKYMSEIDLRGVKV